MEYGTYTQRRQELKGFFYDNGSVYVVRADLVKKGTLFGKKVERIVTTRQENIEIDDEFDFWINEHILLKRMKEGR